MPVARLRRLSCLLATAAMLALGDADSAAALSGVALDRLTEMGLRGHPAAADALETLGLARLVQGRVEEAVRRLSILNLDPRKADEDARERLEAALREDPRDAVALARLAAIRALEGAEAEAAAEATFTTFWQSWSGRSTSISSNSSSRRAPGT